MATIKTKYPQGYTQSEIRQIARDNNIDESILDEEIGLVTGLIVDDEMVIYHDDVDRAVYRILNKKKESSFEWD